MQPVQGSDTYIVWALCIEFALKSIASAKSRASDFGMSRKNLTRGVAVRRAQRNGGERVGHRFYRGRVTVGARSRSLLPACGALGQGRGTPTGEQICKSSFCNSLFSNFDEALKSWSNTIDLILDVFSLAGVPSRRFSEYLTQYDCSRSLPVQPLGCHSN